MTYSANDLQTLEGLDAVRKRPGMYIGSTDDAGRSHLVYEIVDNSVDEALAGHCTRIDVTLDADGYCTVADNGRGIPVDVNTKTGLSGVEMAIGSLHSGGKFGGSGYRSAGGLHGVGAAVTNALSERLDVEVKRDGKVHTLSYQRGVSGVFKDGKFAPKKGLRVEGKCDKGDTGTTVRFKPDDAIFMPDSKFDVDAIRERLRRTAFLVPAVTIVFHHGGQVEEFHFDGGISDLAEALSDGTRIGDVINITGTGTFVETVPMLTADGNMEMTDVEREVEVSVAIVATTGYEPLTQSFCNIVHTSAGGSHEKGYEQGILKWARENVNAKAKDPQIVIADVLEGLTTVVMVGFPEPQFTSQDKRCLGSKQVQPIVADVVYNGLTAWAKQRGNGVNAKTILEKMLTAARVRVATKEERDTKRRKTALENGNNLPAKLVDCRSRDNSELILIEGDSAAGCFVGETLVATVEGRAYTFAELVSDWDNGILHYGYASDDKGDPVVVPLIEPRITKIAESLVDVTLDNGEVIRCTPDHLFRLRDGGYRRADALVEGTSLMPLYRSLTEKRGPHANSGVGYEFCHLNSRPNTTVLTHHLSDVCANGVHDGESHRHHIDQNKRNNDPRNLVRLTTYEHLSFHGNDPATRERMREGYERWLANSGREELSKRLSGQWKDPEFARMCAEKSKERMANEDYVAALVQAFQSWYAGLSEAEKEEYRENMGAISREYWSSQEARDQQARRVAQYFVDNPEARENARAKANAQWSDESLRVWRAEKSREQMTDPAMKEATAQGRAKYMAATTREERSARVIEGKIRTALAALNTLQAESNEPLKRYMALRQESPKRFYAIDRLMERVGVDTEDELLVVAATHNHKVVSVVPVAGRVPVYDLTVDEYHNFALESGVFVHNSVRGGRNSDYQAYLPLRGKILNTWKATPSAILGNAEVAAIIQCLGAGSGRTFNTDDMRYDRVILLMDADVDGAHIRTLIITMFAKLMPALISEGRLYAAVPPLYHIVTVGKDKQERFAYSDSERDAIIAEFEKSGKQVKTPIQRFKGLGEMDANELKVTTLDPTVRKLRRITMRDAGLATERFELLMGNEVGPRKDFIMNNARITEGE